MPTDIEKTCCAWCGETENLVHDHDPPQGRNTQPSFVQVLCEECHVQKTAEDCFFDDGWRPWVSVLNSHTHEYFQLAAREKPFVWKSPHGKTQRRVGCELDFRKQYRHVLMYPGMEWAVYAPTDSFSAGDPEAVWSFVDKGPPGTDLREQAYRGPAFYLSLIHI